MNSALFFGKAGDERGTPVDLFAALHTEFGFTLDAAASSLNHKCDLWFGEGGIAEDALQEDWGGEGSVVWCNPPYSIAGAFIAKAREEAQKGATVVLLVPARTDTRWWHDYLWSERTHSPQTGVEVRFVRGRLTFELVVPQAMRDMITGAFEIEGVNPGDTVRMLVEKTGLPQMAIVGVAAGQPDDKLLSSAPFPSAIVILRGQPQ